MADAKGRAVGELAGSPPSKAPANDGALPACIGCGRVHGSIGVHIHCLGDEVLRLRRLLVAHGLGEHARR